MKYKIIMEHGEILSFKEISYKKNDVRYRANFYLYLLFSEGRVMLCTHSMSLVSLVNTALRRLGEGKDQAKAVVTRIDTRKGEHPSIPSDRLKGKTILTVEVNYARNTEKDRLQSGKGAKE